MTNDLLNGVVGLAVGNAMGVAGQGRSKESLKFAPVLTAKSSAWSSSTSLTLCLVESLQCNAWNLNYQDIMERFSQWLKNGYLTTDGKAIDIDPTIKHAIENYLQGIALEHCAPRNQWDCGNGSLLHILPITFYLLFRSNEPAYEAVRNVSALTHAHISCTLGCYLYCILARTIIEQREQALLPIILRIGIKQAISELEVFADIDDMRELAAYHRIVDESIYKLPLEEIENSGYIVDTLEAALWCLENTKSYRECILWAANIGEDTRGLGAVVGSLAGMYYGIENYPREWVQSLKNSDIIFNICSKT